MEAVRGKNNNGFRKWVMTDSGYTTTEVHFLLKQMGFKD
jgi:hypothetical protein